MKKSISGLLLIGILVMWSITGVAALENETDLFRDVTETDWFYPYLEELQEHNTFSGFEDSTFRPAHYITADDFAVLMSKSIGFMKEMNGAFNNTMNDIYPSEMVRNIISASTYVGSAKDPLTRYDAAKMLTLLTVRNTSQEDAQIIPLISDYQLIPEAYQNAVLEAYGKGILSGYPDGAFKGEEFVTRAEAAIMVSKLLHENRRSDLSEKVSAYEASLLEEENTRNRLIETALQFQGVPYRWGGTSPSGFDSSGFIWYVFQENGIDIPRVSFDIYRFGDPISQDDLKPGDLVFFEGYRPGPSHGSIYIGDGQFIHSPSTGKTITIDSLSDPAYWGPKRYGAIRII